MWHEYYDTRGGIALIWPAKYPGPTCPTCELMLIIRHYRAECCDETFRVTGFGSRVVRRVRPIGKHTKTSGRGWASVRPWDGKDEPRK